MKGLLLLGFVGAAVAGLAYLDVRALPRGGSITVEGPDGQPLEAQGAGTWNYDWRETAKIWLLGRLP